MYGVTVQTTTRPPFQRAQARNPRRSATTPISATRSATGLWSAQARLWLMKREAVSGGIHPSGPLSAEATRATIGAIPASATPAATAYGPRGGRGRTARYAAASATRTEIENRFIQQAATSAAEASSAQRMVGSSSIRTKQ